ncbi:MAG: Stk1 family PASTA domain-containing Ser/Thr kinase [Eggerthellaceae bacterium]|nr:Stk1 family PASTA domain-containing Ser/Thr kinase [Eggerthellaceae bacterium]
MTGRVFNNRYQITDRVGIGGMAEVYQAQDRVLGRRVAVKVMLPQYASDPEFTRRFRQEAASAANLSSPYIVNVYDWGQDDGTYYIVMEYVRGSDLKTAIQQRGPVNQRKVAEIGSQVCQALSVAHNQDIIHRDIKPQNIMIQPDGNIKVMDFGIARAKNSMEQRTSAVLGTAHYISPEQAQGKELTAASDIYSLGVVLYEAATGELPFDGPDAVSVATKQVNEYPLLPSEINPDIDPALETIILRALEKDPMARFATAADMKKALNDYLSGRNSMSFANQTTSYMPGYGPAMGDATQVMDPGVQMGGMNPVNPINPVNPVHTGRNDDDSSHTRRKGRGLKIFLAFLVALVALGLAANALLNSSPTAVAVPDVSGMTVEAATQELEAAGFTTGDQTKVYSETVDEGLVVGTDPAANRKAEPGSTVDLLVSQGTQQMEVPDLTGMTASEAQQALKQAGLTAKAGTSKNSDTVEKDHVMSQDPEAGTMVDAGSTVTYVVSLGSSKQSVPDVRGQSQGNAIATLQNAGFEVVANDTAYDDNVPEGHVISQSPDAGEKLAKGGTVSLVISLGANSHYVSGSVTPAEGGSITLSASQVEYGGGVSYTVTVYDGYAIASVTDNYGSSYGASPSGYIGNITADTNIIVTLIPLNYYDTEEENNNTNTNTNTDTNADGTGTTTTDTTTTDSTSTQTDTNGQNAGA